MSERYFAQPSVMSAQQHFAQVPAAEIQRSRFDRSHAVKTTFDAGLLIPVFLDEVLPGDTFTLSTTAFARLATPLKPIMDNMYVDIHYFFVPNRLVFDQWAEFMGERPTPNFDPNTVAIPTQPWNPGTPPSTTPETVGKYFGLPMVANVTTAPYEQVSCLPFRAYNLIYNEWYRDQNLINPAVIDTGVYNPSTDIDFTPRRRGKRHDYFTSCLPWPQKGDPVTIPLAGDINVYGYNDLAVSPFVMFDSNNPVELRGAGGTSGAVNYNSGAVNFPNANPGLRLSANPLFPIGRGSLDDATAVSVNDLRTAFQIQRLLERDARGGTRYIELILSHFGVRSDDARLQRPEYLGGGSQRVNINPIASTVAETSIPQANLAAVGTSLTKAGFQKSFTEHGLIIGLASVRADLTYQRGIDRMWSRKTRYDYYWPTLAHLGEQAVLNKEIHFTGVGEPDNSVFGYQERYAEYRYKPSIITGKFNSWAQNSLDVWHLAQDFESAPALNGAFIREEPPVDRVIAVPAEPHFLCDIWHDLKCDRPMPVYSVPGLIDHF